MQAEVVHANVTCVFMYICANIMLIAEFSFRLPAPSVSVREPTKNRHDEAEGQRLRHVRCFMYSGLARQMPAVKYRYRFLSVHGY
jgi:hypothetical protein